MLLNNGLPEFCTTLNHCWWQNKPAWNSTTSHDLQSLHVPGISTYPTDALQHFWANLDALITLNAKFIFSRFFLKLETQKVSTRSKRTKYSAQSTIKSGSFSQTATRLKDNASKFLILLPTKKRSKYNLESIAHIRTSAIARACPLSMFSIRSILSTTLLC